MGWGGGFDRKVFQVKTSNHVCCWGSPSATLAVGEVLYSRIVQRVEYPREIQDSPEGPFLLSEVPSTWDIFNGQKTPANTTHEDTLTRVSKMRLAPRCPSKSEEIYS